MREPVSVLVEPGNKDVQITKTDMTLSFSSMTMYFGVCFGLGFGSLEQTCLNCEVEERRRRRRAPPDERWC